MNEAQLKLWCNMIVAAMKAGDMDKVAELYGKFSALASMEDAAKLEAMIAAAMS